MNLSESHYNTFFQAVKQGSVDEIRMFLEFIGIEETCKLLIQQAWRDTSSTSDWWKSQSNG